MCGIIITDSLERDREKWAEEYWFRVKQNLDNIRKERRERVASTQFDSAICRIPTKPKLSNVKLEDLGIVYD